MGTMIATCGHDVTDRPSYQVAVRVWINDFDADALAEAVEIATYCEACTNEARTWPSFLWARRNGV